MRGKSLVALLVVMLVGCGQRSPDHRPSLAPVESGAKVEDAASQVTLTSDKQAEIEEKGAGDPAPKTETAFLPLFNGKNLDGWQVREARPGDKDKWSVKDGILVAEPGSGWIGTTKTYGDFVLKVEWRISEGGNSGVYIRMPEVTTSKEAADKGLEVQILDDNDPKWKGKDLQPWMWCGSLYTVQGPSKKVFKGAGQWNEYEITCKGGRISVVFNGEKVVDVDASNRPKQGFIGFQNHGSKVEFRSVQLKALGEDKQPVVVAEVKEEKKKVEPAKKGTSPTELGQRPKSDASKVLQTQTWAWKGSKDNYANYSDGAFEIGMGAEKNGIGIAAVGVETKGTKLARIAVHVQDGRPASYSSIDANSFAGFIIDYSTDGAYRNRVALATGSFSEKRWAKVPPWGSMDLPNQFERIKTRNVTAYVHSLDLTKWAPPNWDGRAWVTVLLQNTGKNTSMRGIIWFPDDDEKKLEDGFAGQYLLTFTGSGSGKTKWDFTADGTASESTELNSSAWKLMGSWRAVDKRIVLTFTNPKFGTTILEKKGDMWWEGDNTHANGTVFHWVLTRQNTEVAKVKTTPGKTNEELLREQLARPFEFHDDKRKERESLLKANGFDKLGYDKGPNGEELIVKHGNEKVTLLGGAVTDLDFSVSGFINPSKEFVPHGRRVTWYRKPTDENDSGKPFTESYFFNGKRHGLTVSWCTNGRLGELVAYVEGLRQGPYQKWYDNGDKYSAGLFKNDKLEGEYSSWYCGGSRWEACTFKNGVLDGVATVYWQAELGGKPLKIVTWSQGVKNGPEIHYHWQGHKEREMTWLNGRLHGNYIEYENGLIKLKMAFSNGVPVLSP